jgi:hypothetical protein
MIAPPGESPVFRPRTGGDGSQGAWSRLTIQTAGAGTLARAVGLWQATRRQPRRARSGPAAAGRTSTGRSSPGDLSFSPRQTLSRVTSSREANRCP